MHENKELISARPTVDPLCGSYSQSCRHHNGEVKSVLLTHRVETDHWIKLRRLELRESSTLHVLTVVTARTQIPGRTAFLRSQADESKRHFCVSTFVTALSWQFDNLFFHEAYSAFLARVISSPD
jgi:hypothetical protein